MSNPRLVDVGTAARDAIVSDWGGVCVAAGHIVETRYVPVEDVVFDAREHQLSPTAVERAYCRQLELGEDQAWPPPTGHWRDDGRFVLTDGRHRFVAALMLGMEYVLVAWLIPPDEACGRCAGTTFDGNGEPCQFCRPRELRMRPFAERSGKRWPPETAE